MKLWRALALTAFLAASLAAAASATTSRSAAVPVCAKGQAATKAHPCTTQPAATTPAPTGSPVPVTDPNPDTGVTNPDTADQGMHVCGCDSVTIMQYLDPSAGKYRLLIYNTSGIGWINSVNWLPPSGLTVTAITSTSGGSCKIDAGDIACTANGYGLAPPKCTCETGGMMSVSFTATGDEPVFNGSWWIYHGLVGAYMQITSMTPVPYHIPSYLPPKGQV